MSCSCEKPEEIKGSDFTCSCCDGEREKTQLKVCWEANEIDADRAIFVSPGTCKLIASGTISYECNSSDPTGSIIVRFWRGAPGTTTAIQEIEVDEGSCVAFVAKNFNSITVSVTQGSGLPAQGELCIVPNYKITG